jgi:hypothetical protein
MIGGLTMIISTDGIDPVVESDGDKVHRVARAMIGMVPVLNGPALEIFNSLIEPPIERRKREWMLQVTAVVNQIQANLDLDIESLASNEQFISVLLNASQIALRNHQKEKIIALKVALLNTARNTDLTEDQQLIFLSLLDGFTMSHIKILESSVGGFCWSPRFGASNRDVLLLYSIALISDFTEFKDQADLIFQIVSELEAKKLLQIFRIQHVQTFPDNKISIMGASEWGQLLNFTPAKHHKLDLDSDVKYVALPTELGIKFLNYIMCDE